MVVNTVAFYDSDVRFEDVDITGLPVLYVMVDTPRDQAALQRHFAVLGYVPYLLAEFDGYDSELWRFHHPDGPKPL